MTLRNDELISAMGMLGADTKARFRVKRALRHLRQGKGEPAANIITLTQHGIPAWEYVKPYFTVYEYNALREQIDSERTAELIVAGIRRDYLPL